MRNVKHTPDPAHEIAHNLLLAHTGSEGGSPTINWYGLRAEIADAIAVTLDKQRRLAKPPSDARSIITNTIGFNFEPGELQTVNADDLIRLAAAINAGRGHMESDPQTLRNYCCQLLDLLENYGVEIEGEDNDLIAHISSAVDPSYEGFGTNVENHNEIKEFVLDWLPSDAAGDDFKARLICKLDLLNTTERR